MATRARGFVEKPTHHHYWTSSSHSLYGRFLQQSATLSTLFTFRARSTNGMTLNWMFWSTIVSSRKEDSGGAPKHSCLGRHEGDHPTDTKEAIQCGMETTVTSRFEELCLKKVSIIGQNLTKENPELRLDVCFGDSRIGHVHPEDCNKGTVAIPNSLWSIQEYYRHQWFARVRWYVKQDFLYSLEYFFLKLRSTKYSTNRDIIASKNPKRPQNTIQILWRF